MYSLTKHIVIILMVIFINPLSLFSQDSKNVSSKLNFELEKSIYLSQAGLSSAFKFNFVKKRHLFGVGPKLIINSSAFNKKILGVDLNYRYSLLESNKLKSFVDIHYGFASYNLENQFDKSNNNLHEFIISNGFRYNIYGNICIGNTIGLGFYQEQFYDTFNQSKRSFLGYNLMFKLFVSYVF
jgi:hypothetical protein